MERTRRLRYKNGLRALVRETTLQKEDFIYPMFVTYQHGARKEIQAMPGCYQLGVDLIAREAEKIARLGIPAIILFGIPETKDEMASSALDDKGIIQKALREIKKHLPELIVITDICLCEYTSHGHCGIIKGNIVDNDATIEILAKIQRTQV